jgi:uncharacterized protein YacL
MWERNYPWLGSLIITPILYFVGFRPSLKGYEKVLDGVITFTSIVIGFLAALLAIILSISKSKIMRHLYEYLDKQETKGKGIFISFFRQSLLAGFILVLLSIWMYIIKEVSPTPIYGLVVFVIWMLLGIFFIFSSYRIIEILMITLFQASKEDHKRQYVQSDAMTQQQIEELKRKSART